MKPFRESLGTAPACKGRHLWGAQGVVALTDLLGGSNLGGRISELSGRSVLIASRDHLSTAMALIELDTVARRLVICPPDLPAEHLPSIIANAGIDAIISDGDSVDLDGLGVPLHVTCPAIPTYSELAATARYPTEWVLLSSGTTGVPKMVVHNLASLTGAIKIAPKAEIPVIWATFFDLRRFGGLQILFRALLCGGSLVLSSSEEPFGNFLTRLGNYKVTHVHGTPSHWRRVLMTPSARLIEPRYIRLSGEMADQAILNNLRSFYPHAAIAHAYASTEAGVAFEVEDGREGFPANLLTTSDSVELKVEDGSLRIRSPRTASAYIGADDALLSGEDGFVDTGDMVEQRGDRYYFLGRRSGVINVGGLKVHPEEVEAVINRHPAVRMSLVCGRPNPITGSIVIADVVLLPEIDQNGQTARMEALKREILQLCRETLTPYKVPAMIRIVPDLDVSATGKLVRHA